MTQQRTEETVGGRCPQKPEGAAPATVTVLPREMRHRCGTDLMKNEKRPGDRGESQRAAAGRTENRGKRSGGEKAVACGISDCSSGGTAALM